MTKDEIQVWMFAAFILGLALSAYKVYMIFTKPAPGPDMKTQHLQLQAIIIGCLKDIKNENISSQELFALLEELDELRDGHYKNFNQNRLNQLLQQLYFTYEVGSLRELILTVQNNG